MTLYLVPPVASFVTLELLSTLGFLKFLREVLGGQDEYADALNFLKYGRVKVLQVEKNADDGAILRMGVQGDDLYFVTGLAHSRTQPLEISCSCCPGKQDPVCPHTKLFFLVLWITLQRNFAFAGLLPSVTDKLREFEGALRGVFSQLLAESPTPETLKSDARNAKIELTHLYLHLGEPQPLTDSSYSILEFPEALTPKRAPQMREFSVYPSPTLVGGAQIPDFFATSPRQRISSSYWGNEQTDQQLRMGVQFGFSNGLVIGFADLLFHPLASRVPRDLLPLVSSLRPEVQQNPNLNLFGEEHFSRWGGREVARQILLSVMLNAAPRIAKEEIQFYLVDHEDPSRPRKGLKLRGFEVTSIPRFRWALRPPVDQAFGVAELVFEGAQAPEEQGGGETEQIYYQFEIDSTRQAMRIHNYGAWIRSVAHILPSFLELGESGGGVPSVLPSIIQRYRIEGHAHIEELLREVDRKLAQLGAPLVERTLAEVVPESQITPQLWVETSGEMRFELKVQTKTQGCLSLWNLPAATGLFIRVLNQGIGGASHSKNTDIAQDRKGEKRDRDLKILRHTGLASALFIACAEAAEKLTSAAELLEQVGRRWVLLLTKQGEIPREVVRDAREAQSAQAVKEKKLSHYCSRRVMELLESVILVLAETIPAADSVIFTPQGELRLQGVSKMVLQMFHALILASVEQSQGSVFLKTRVPIFEDFLGPVEDIRLRDFALNASDPGTGLGPQRYQLVHTTRSLKGALEALASLAKHRFELYYNGRKIESFEETDLRAEFRVSHNLQEASQELATGGRLDWFALHPKVFFKGTEIDPARLTELAGEGVIEFHGQYYLLKKSALPSVKRLERFWANLQGGAAGEGPETRGKTSERYYRLPKCRTLEILALRASGVVVEGGKEWQEICAFYDALGTRDGATARTLDVLPASLHVELKAFQKQSVQWLLDLYRLRLGGILADDMGLGKTVQTLAFLEKLRSEGKLGRVLIVVPTSLTYNWVSEAARFAPELPIQIFQRQDKADIASRGTDRVIVATYGLLTEHQEFFAQFAWNILVFDEAQNLKNIAAKRTSAARSLEVQFKLCLTGTPLENHLGEFFSLMDLVVPGALGELSEFQRRYVNPEQISRDDVQFLRLKSKPLLLRRTKNQVLLELPSKTESEVKLPFEKKQERIYRDIALSWNEKVKGSIEQYGEAKSHLMMLTALLRLRQACSDPGGIPQVKYTEVPPKAELLLESLLEIIDAGESALVFTQFLHTLHRLEQMMQSAGIKVFTIHGGTTRVQRERILSEFQASPLGAVLLMTLKTGGVGLNLVKASYVFHLEPWWNPAVENQATDRAHRMGQVKPVQVFRYLILDSVEEKIKVLKARKSAQFDAMFEVAETESGLEADTPNKVGAGLSQRDFEYLLS
ncbi:DEAD/DEAH box helicase [Bdellovibrionota bacterium FG-2]